MSKPEPAEDIWEKLDAALKETKGADRALPPGAFTIAEFENRYGISRPAAHYRLGKLMAAGKVRCAGYGRSAYYTFVGE